MERRMNVGDIVKHFKREGLTEEQKQTNQYLYKIIALDVKHTETGERFAVYQALYGNKEIFARPMDMFFSEVDREKYPDAKQVYRLELVGDENENNIK